MKKILFMISMLGMGMLYPDSLKAQQEEVILSVSGIVKDYQSGKLLNGCHVFVTHDMGTVTDERGEFELVIPISLMEEQIHFSYLGFETRSVSVTEFNGNPLTIPLKSQPIFLKPVVIVGKPYPVTLMGLVTRGYDLLPNKLEPLLAIINELNRLQVTELQNLRPNE